MRNESGFTFTEMMVVIAILAILAAIAIPNFFGWMPAKRLQSAAGEVQSAMQTARLGAVKENTDAVVKFNKDDESYTVTVGGQTVRSGQMPAGVDITDVYKFNSLVPVTNGEIKFNSRGLLSSDSADVHLKNNVNAKMKISISLTGGTKITKIN